jgi:hypothetical protein
VEFFSMTPQEIRQRFLNAIAGPESAGRYDVRYTPRGGTQFTGYDTHPRIYEPGPKGPSSAAGRYQITYQTYKGLGGGPFTPEAQDEMAWRLGTQRYKASTGRDLEADLRDQGFTPQIMRTLGPTWEGLQKNPQKAAEWFQRPVGEGGGEFRAQAADTAQVGSPAAQAPVAPVARPQAPVYANDFGTAARRFGNFLAPSMVEAPQPLAPDQAQAQIAQQRQMQTDLSQANDAMRAFSALSAYGSAQKAREDQPMSLLQPSIVRGRVVPIQFGRGLL